MTDALITIETEEFVPCINARGPHRRVVVHSWQRKMLQDLHFPVEVHEEPYSAIAAHNARVATMKTAPVKAPAPAKVETPVIQEAKPVVVEAPEAAPVEPEAVAEETAPEDEALDLDELRKRVDALQTFKEAQTLLAELGMELDPAPTKLKDAREALLKAIDEAAA